MLHNMHLTVLAGTAVALAVKNAYDHHQHCQQQEEARQEDNRTRQDEEARKQEQDAAREERIQLLLTLRSTARRLSVFAILTPEMEKYAAMTDEEIYATT